MRLIGGSLASRPGVCQGTSGRLRRWGHSWRVVCVGVLIAVPAPAQNLLDETCVVSALNRAARVRADGSWVLANVPTTQGLARVRATCVANGVTRTGQSSLIAVPSNGVIQVADIDFDSVQPVPVELALAAPATTLSAIGATAQLQAIARYPDGSQTDVTGGDAGTDYRTSNATIVTVSSGGLVTARASGAAMVSALDDGALAVLRFQVVTSGDSDGDGIPDDWEIAHGLDPNQPIDAQEDPDTDGLTNLEEYQLGTEPRNADTDADGLRDGDEDHADHTNPLLYDTDGEGIGDGLEIETGSDPLDAASFNLAAALRSIEAAPASFQIISNTALGGGSQQLRVTGLLTDGHTLDLTPRRYGTTYTSNDLLIAGFGPEDGRVYAGNDGETTIDAAVVGQTATATVTVETFSPRALSYLPIPGFANSAVKSGSYAYVAAGATGLQVVDVSDLEHPLIVGSLDTPGNANDVRVAGDLAFIADGSRGLAVIDAHNPSDPALVAEAATPGVATDLAVSGDLVYVADELGLAIFDAAVPSNPQLVGYLDLPGGRASGVDVSGSFAVVADSEGGVVVVDVSTPASPHVAGRTATRPGGISGAADLVVRDRLAYVADGGSRQLGGLRVVDFSAPSTPAVVGSSGDAFGLTSVAVENGVAVASDFYFVNAVPVFQLAAAGPIFTAEVDFSVPPIARAANGSGVDVDNGVVLLAATSTNGAGYIDNGTSGESGLFIGRYALFLDQAGVPPSVTLTEPVDGGSAAERSLLRIAADARDDIRVQSVDFVVNGERAATVGLPPYEIRYTVPAGATSLTISAVARDTAGNSRTAEPVTVAVTPNPAPVVRLITPAGGSTVVAGTQMPLAAAATSAQQMTQVDFSVNGALVAATTSAPYQTTYAVPQLATELRMSVIAHDAFGPSAPDSATVTVLPDQPPVAVFLEPRDGDEVVEGSLLLVHVGLSDDVGVTQATFSAAGSTPLTRLAPPWEWAMVAPASGATKQLQISARDTVGHSTQVTITITGVADPLTSVHGMVVDPEGQPVEGAQVVEGGSGEEATTGADGEFVISGVPTAYGGLLVTASASLSGAPYVAESPSFSPVPGGQVEVGQLQLEPDPYAATVTGRLVNGAGSPVAAGTVVVVAPGATIVKGMSGPDGSFRLPGVPTYGDVQVVASEVSGLFTLQAKTASPVPVTGGSSTEVGTLTLVPTELPTTVRGTVVDSALNPVAGAEVKVYDSELFVTTTSDADGSFELAELPAGDGSDFVFFTISARIVVGGELYRGSSYADAVADGVTDVGQVALELVPPSGVPTTTVQGQVDALSGQTIGLADVLVVTEADAYLGLAAGGAYAVAGVPSDEGGILVNATAALDGRRLSGGTYGSYTAEPGGTTLIDPISIDDTFASGGVARLRQAVPGSRWAPTRGGLYAAPAQICLGDDPPWGSAKSMQSEALASPGRDTVVSRDPSEPGNRRE